MSRERGEFALRVIVNFFAYLAIVAGIAFIVMLFRYGVRLEG